MHTITSQWMRHLMAAMAILFVIFGLPAIQSFASPTQATARAHCACEDSLDKTGEEDSEEHDEPCLASCELCACCGASAAMLAPIAGLTLFYLPPPARLPIAHLSGAPSAGIPHDIFQPPRART